MLWLYVLFSGALLTWVGVSTGDPPMDEYAAEDIVEMLSRMTPQDNQFSLSGVIINGRLNLSGRSIPVSVSLTNCVFNGEVDISYCDFAQWVDFSESRFKSDFKSSEAIYRLGIRCDGAIFEGAVVFNDTKSAGNVCFDNAQFENPSAEISFVRADYGNLFLAGSVFSGRASFVGLRCADSVSLDDARFEGASGVTFQLARVGSIGCHRATFKGPVSFNGLRCEWYASFMESRFEYEKGKVDFTHGVFGDLICIGASFKGGATFDLVQCRIAAFFRDTQFENKEKNISFLHATFTNLDCASAVFKGDADFRDLRCEESTIFRDTRFEKNANFNAARLGVAVYDGAIFSGPANFKQAQFDVLQCIGAVFEDGVTFNGVLCRRSAFFENARFAGEGKIDFIGTKFRSIDCSGATFKCGADFTGLQCEGNGYFRRTRFEAKAKTRFVDARFDFLECQSALFNGKVHFDYTQVSGRLTLWGTRFQDDVSFQNMSVRNLSLFSLQDERPMSDHFPFNKKIDLRQFTFDDFEGTKGQQRRIVDVQALSKFSQDPYLQFEQYYRSIGDDAYAKDVYYAGRLSLRRKASHWGGWKRMGDWFLCWTVGYGVKIWRLLILWMLPLLTIGTIVFWSDAALTKKEESNISAAISSLGHKFLKEVVTEERADRSTAVYKFFKHLGHRVWYSTDLFMPVVDLQIVKEYGRPQGLRGIYTVFHVIMGWVLVPLLIASLSGVIKK